MAQGTGTYRFMCRVRCTKRCQRLAHKADGREVGGGVVAQKLRVAEDEAGLVDSGRRTKGCEGKHWERKRAGDPERDGAVFRLR